MKKKYLLLCEKIEDYPDILNVEINTIYRPLSKIGRIFRYIHLKSRLLPSLRYFWLGNWNKNIEEYQQIGIFDSIFDYTPLEFIRSKRPDIKLAFCYRNRVQCSITHSVIKRNPLEIKEKFSCTIWSYNEEDCKYYDLKHYNQFHLIPKEILNQPAIIKYDVYFIGLDKGRLNDLIKIDQILTRIGFKTKIKVVPSANTSYSDKDIKYLTSPYSYKKVLNHISQCKCVIDWVGKTNRGITFRSLEAAIMGKKLITNFEDIQKLDYYTPNNIFIWNKDSLDKLKEFINSDFDYSVQQKLEKYSFSNFCCTIFNS